jgi:hypothetical protein
MRKEPPQFLESVTVIQTFTGTDQLTSVSLAQEKENAQILLKSLNLTFNSKIKTFLKRDCKKSSMISTMEIYQKRRTTEIDSLFLPDFNSFYKVFIYPIKLKYFKIDFVDE